ncbi:MAG: hypothetical protein SWJ54_07125, partial [Cyanobacteriota bacterium]|nr:hypothetical protein [Cyanobacteriota bacterium]
VQNIPTEPTELDPITEVLTELQRVTQSLEHDVIRQQDWDTMNVRIKLLEEALSAQNLTPIDDPEHSPVTSDYSTANSTISDIQPPESSVETPDSQTEPEVNLDARIEHIHRQVVKLDRQNREIVKPYLIRLTRAIKNLQNN